MAFLLQPAFCNVVDVGEQFPLIATQNGFIPRTRHASRPCWETHLGMIKDPVSDLQRRLSCLGHQYLCNRRAIDKSNKLQIGRATCAKRKAVVQIGCSNFLQLLHMMKNQMTCRRVLLVWANSLAVMDFIQGNVKTKDLVVNV